MDLPALFCKLLVIKVGLFSFKLDDLFLGVISPSAPILTTMFGDNSLTLEDFDIEEPAVNFLSSYGGVMAAPNF